MKKAKKLIVQYSVDSEGHIEYSGDLPGMVKLLSAILPDVFKAAEEFAKAMAKIKG